MHGEDRLSADADEGRDEEEERDSETAAADPSGRRAAAEARGAPPGLRSRDVVRGDRLLLGERTHERPSEQVVERGGRDSLVGR